MDVGTGGAYLRFTNCDLDVSALRAGDAKRPTAPHRAHAKRAGRTIGQKRSFCPQGAEVVRYRSVKANAQRNFWNKVSCWLESGRSYAMPSPRLRFYRPSSMGHARLVRIYLYRIQLTTNGCMDIIMSI